MRGGDVYEEFQSRLLGKEVRCDDVLMMAQKSTANDRDDHGTECYLCLIKTPANEELKSSKIVRCRNCGVYEIANILVGDRHNWSSWDELRPYLSAHTRQTHEAGGRAKLNRGTWKALAEEHQRSSIKRKAELLFNYIGERYTVRPDYDVTLLGNHAPLFDCKTYREIVLLLQHLAQKGWINREIADNGSLASLTFDGWHEYETKRDLASTGNKCFVAMSFDKSLEPIYDSGIRPAVLACEYEPVRVDLIHHNEKICDRIIAEITGARFVVADFTMHRQGVYFEAGFAKGLGREVIFTCRADDIKKAHFDTNHYNHIVWESAEDLRRQLTDRINVTVRLKG